MHIQVRISLRHIPFALVIQTRAHLPRNPQALVLNQSSLSPQNPNGLPYGCPDPRRKESEGGGLLTTRSEYLVVILVSGPLTRAITTYTDRYRCAPGGVKHTLIPLGQR